MNRTIKFRAWDASKNKMREVTSINWYDEYLWVDETPLSGDRLLISVTPIMQFAGLTDKNGKEVYEGDIIKYRYEAFSEYTQEYDLVKEGISVVEFKFCAFSFKIDDMQRENVYESEDGDWIEVIGNIHENPELLS